MISWVYQLPSLQLSSLLLFLSAGSLQFHSCSPEGVFCQAAPVQNHQHTSVSTQAKHFFRQDVHQTGPISGGTIHHKMFTRLVQSVVEQLITRCSPDWSNQWWNNTSQDVHQTGPISGGTTHHKMFTRLVQSVVEQLITRCSPDWSNQ